MRISPYPTAAWLLSALPLIHCQEAAVVSTLTVYAWPLSAPSPTPFATVEVEGPSLAKVISVDLPKASDDDIVRVGLYDTKKKTWTGIAAPMEAFQEDVRKKLVLHVDEDQRVYHIGYGIIPEKEDLTDKKGMKKKKAAAKAKKNAKPKTQKALEREERERRRDLELERKRRKRKGLPLDDGEPFVVEVVQKQNGPSPVLNKPIVVSPEGKAEGVVEVDQRSFIQKYWWMIALFLVMQVVTGGGGGGGGEEKKE